MATIQPEQDRSYIYYFALPNGQEIEFVAANTPPDEVHTFGFADENGAPTELQLTLPEIIERAHRVVDRDHNTVLEEVTQ